MTILQYVWLCVMVVLATFLGSLTFHNPVMRATMRLFGGSVEMTAAMSLLAASFLAHVGLVLFLGWSVSIGAAIVAASLAAFVWGQSAYLLMQRFAGPLEMPGLVMQSPSLLPFAAFLAFLSSTVALAVVLAWYWAALPLLIWLALGYISAEIAIRRYMRQARKVGAHCDRGLAVFAVNDAQGRRDLLSTNRYPFP